ncbi:hypothetical protein BHM03_00050023 [Ensete ventricosum]|nr:hypothetical protein BHM03_00050023 [Ensete ventricosum]
MFISRLSVRRPPATGRFRQKSTVDGRFRSSTADLREKSATDSRLREKSTIGGQLSEKKGKRRRGKEEKKEKKKEYLAPTRRPRPRAVATRGSPALARRRRPRFTSAFSLVRGKIEAT